MHNSGWIIVIFLPMWYVRSKNNPIQPVNKWKMPLLIRTVKELTFAFSFFPCNVELHHFCYQKRWLFGHGLGRARALSRTMVALPRETLKKPHSLDVHLRCFPQWDLRMRYSSVALHNQGLVLFYSWLMSPPMLHCCTWVVLDLHVQLKIPNHKNK